MNKESKNNIKVAFILNLMFSIIELVGGIITNSISIISDSVHDFGDSIAIAISFFLEKKSLKQPDENYTYGYRRYSVLGGLITSVILLIGSVIVIYNAIPRLLNPQLINYDGMLILAVLGFIINGIAVLKTRKGRGINERAVSLHLLEDVLGWVVVLITSLIMKIWDKPILDPILSIGITIYILKHVVENIKEIFEILLEKAPKGIDVEHIKQELLENDNIKDIHHVHLWTADGINSYITMHVVINNISKDEIINIKKYVREKLNHDSISHVTIEIEFEEEGCIEDKCVIEENNNNDLSHHHHHHH